MGSRAAQVESGTPGPYPSPVPTTSYPVALPEGAIKRKDRAWGSGKVRLRAKGHGDWGGVERGRPGRWLRVDKVAA